jgi:hypothetical protein
MYGSRQPVARCSFCNAPYQSCRPLIQGAGNALICAGCLRSIEKAISLPSIYPVLPDISIRDTSVDDSLQSENPFNPPSSGSCCAAQCSFCAQSHSGAVSLSQFNSHVICNDCVVYSMQLLAEAIDSGGQPRNT